MASQGRESKARAQRIELDYYKTPDGIQRGKLALTFLGVVAVAAWFALNLEWDGRTLKSSAGGRLRSSPGPLIEAHATWEANCEACHVPFTPIKGNSPLDALALTAKTSTAASRCESCHAGSAHHAAPAGMNVAKNDCAGCHQDHQGRLARLTRLDDSKCKSCHAMLGDFRHEGSANPALANIEGFSTGLSNSHPEFEPLKHPDPGGIKFNHALHMSPGLTTTPGGKPFLASKIRLEKDRDAYRGSSGVADSSVSLRCQSCHATNPADLRAPGRVDLSVAATTGASMLPIRYEVQCRACHELGFDTTKPDMMMTHRIQPSEVSTRLREYFSGEILRDDPAFMARYVPARPGLGPISALEPKVQTLGDRLVSKVREASTLLFDGDRACQKCHDYASRDQLGAPTQVKAANIPQVWFTHANFDHSAHRGVDCRSCHAGAYPDATPASMSKADVLIPGIESCRQCHAPKAQAGWMAGASSKVASGGATFDCTLCHSYHVRGTEAVAGGTRTIAPETLRDIEQFLRAEPR
ncbi:cytochrome c3 family protein [Isosphaeraceae bacterium EP7]